VLDATAEIDGISVYFEVVAPERSDASAEDQRLVNKLTVDVRARVSKCRVEIEVQSPFDAGSIGPIVAAIEAAAPSTWTLVNSLARVRRIDAGQTLLPMFDGAGHVVVGGESFLQGESTNVIARWESSDARAKRVFKDEYHQFSRTVPNVLVVDLCAVSDGMKLWPGEMARLLQPTRNRKVGAVAFFDQRLLGPPGTIRRRWRLLVNSYAHLPVPEHLLTGIESLDESSAYGLPRPDRVSSSPDC
jgi:hypothetical protein